MAMTLKSQGALHGVVHDSGLAVGAMNSFNKSVLRCRYLWGRTKLSVSKALILPVLLYGSERRTLFCASKSRLDVFCNRSLRRIVRVHLEEQVSKRKGPALDGTANSGQTDTELVSRRMTLPIRSPLDEAIPGGRSPLDELGRGLGRLTRSVVRRKRWAEGLPVGSS